MEMSNGAWISAGKRGNVLGFRLDLSKTSAKKMENRRLGGRRPGAHTLSRDEPGLLLDHHPCPIVNESPIIIKALLRHDQPTLKKVILNASSYFYIFKFLVYALILIPTRSSCAKD